MSAWPTIDDAGTWLGPIPGDARPDAELAIEAAVGWLIEKTTLVHGEDVPAPLVMACRILAAHLFKRRDSPGGVAGFGDEFIRLYAVDADVKALIAPYEPVLMK